MNYKKPKYFYPIPSKKLPLTLISLEEWVLVTIQGKNKIQYLQDQLTCNMFSLKEHQFNFSAHCDVNGKVLSNLYIFNYKKENAIAYIVRKNICNKQVMELKKYSIFSKVAINIRNDILLLGLSGKTSQKIFMTLFNNTFNLTLKPVMQNNHFVSLYFNYPIPRFIFIASKKNIYKLQNKLKNTAKFNNSEQWALLDLEAGYPIINKETYKTFLPQDLNLVKLKGVNFNKGCYMGQEIILRYQNKKKTKFSLYLLTGKNKYTPIPGENLEIKLNNQWYFIGKILYCCRINNNNIWIQATLNERILPHNKIIRTEKKHIILMILYIN